MSATPRKPAAPSSATHSTATPAKPRTTRTAKPSAAKPVTRRTPAASRAATPAARKPARQTTASRSAAVKQAAPAAKPVPAVKKDKPAKAKKVKLVRDSFTMPETEYALIALLKKRCLKAGVSAKKSEILRAAVAGLAKLGDASVVAAIRRLEVIKTGRPAKSSK